MARIAVVPGSQITSKSLRAKDYVPKQKKTRQKRVDWAVYVKTAPTMHKGGAHQAVFRSGVQYFDISYACALEDAQWFVRMFLKALENIGVRTSTRKRR